MGIVQKSTSMSSPSLYELSAQVEPQCMRGQMPLLWDRAQGHHVWNAEGRRWLDWTSGVLVANAGHGHPRVVEAIVQQLHTGVLFNYSFLNEPRIRLASKVASLLPPKFEKVFFLSTGGEAVEAAIKLATAHAKARSGHRRNIIVSFDLAYHGMTLGALLSSGYPALKEWYGSLDARFLQVPFPDANRTSLTTFDSFLQALKAANVEAGQIACVLAEPYQGGTGCFMPQAYYQELVTWCAENEVMFILDEIQSGFGRTGRMFAFEHYDAAPDMICLGKGISSSLPIAAVSASSDILDQFKPGQMGSTQGGNPVCCAAALAAISAIEDDRLVENADALGEILGNGLDGMRRSAIIGPVQGRGLVYGVGVVDRDTRSPSSKLAKKIVEKCFEFGLLLISPIGDQGGTLKICPPLSIDEAGIQEGLGILAAAVKSVEDS